MFPQVPAALPALAATTALQVAGSPPAILLEALGEAEPPVSREEARVRPSPPAAGRPRVSGQGAAWCDLRKGK